MADALFEHYSAILGTSFQRTAMINLSTMAYPSIDLSTLDQYFSEDEVWSVIKEIPPDKAPGPDGFTGLFYKRAWNIIKLDIMNAFNALWALDGRSFHLLNDAYMILLQKKEPAQ